MNLLLIFIIYTRRCAHKLIYIYNNKSFLLIDCVSIVLRCFTYFKCTQKGRRYPYVNNVGLCSSPGGGGVSSCHYAPDTVTRDLGFTVSSEGPPFLVASYDKPGVTRIPTELKSKEGKHTFFVVIWFNKVIIFQPLKVFLLNFHWLIALWDGLTQSERSHNLYYFIDYKFKHNTILRCHTCISYINYCLPKIYKSTYSINSTQN